MSKEATVEDVLGICRRTAVFTCVQCGSKGSLDEVFHVVEVGGQSNPHAAIPVIAGSVRNLAWVCKICPKVGIDDSI